MTWRVGKAVNTITNIFSTPAQGRGDNETQDPEATAPPEWGTTTQRSLLSKRMMESLAVNSDTGQWTGGSAFTDTGEPVMTHTTKRANTARNRQAKTERYFQEGSAGPSSRQSDDEIECIGGAADKKKTNGGGRGSRTAQLKSGNRRSNASPYAASRISADERLLHEQNAGLRPRTSGGQGHASLGPTPQAQFYATGTAHHGTKSDARAPLRSAPIGEQMRRYRSASTVDGHSDFDDDQPEDSGSALPQGRARKTILEHKPMTGTKGGGGFGKHKPAKQQVNTVPDSSDEGEGAYNAPMSGLSDESDYAQKPSSGQKKKKRNLQKNLGTRDVPPMGVTPGERKLANGAGKKQPPKSKGSAANGFEATNFGFTQVKITHSYLMGVEPIMDLRASSLRWNPKTTECNFQVGGEVFRMNATSADKGSQGCPENACPALWFHMITAHERTLAKQTTDYYEIKSLPESVDFMLFLESGATSGRLVDSVISKSKTNGGWGFDTMGLVGTRSMLLSCQEQVSISIDQSPNRRPRRSNATATKSDKQPRNPDTSAVGGMDSGTSKGKKKITKKSKDGEDEDPYQSKLPVNMTGAGNKTTRKKTEKVGTVNLASPEPEPKVTRKSNRLSQNGKSNPMYVDGSDDESNPIPPEPAEKSNPLPPRPDKEKWDSVLFPYPLEGKADINITEGDKWRVEAGDFLNDTLIEFGLKHVLAAIKASTGDDKVDIDKDVCLLNSFFYEKLSSGSRPASADLPWAAYNSVRKWTKSKKVFEKKYLIIPINENAHWYLAVIYNPAGILRESEEPLEPSEDPPPADTPAAATPAATTPLVPPAALPTDVVDDEDADDADKASEGARAKGRSSSPRIRAEADAEEVDASVTLIGPPTPTELPGDVEALPGRITRSRLSGEKPAMPSSSRSTPPKPADEPHSDDFSMIQNPGVGSPDDIMDGNIPRSSPTQPTRVRINREKMRRPGPNEPPIEAPPSSPPGAPIMSETMKFFADQNQTLAVPSAEDKENEKEASPQGNIVVEDASTAKPAAKPKREKLNILNGEDAWIMTFDSLGGAHSLVDKVLKLWLMFEAKDKVPARCPTRFTATRYKEARVPQQPNFSDCGLYLIHFVEQLLSRPKETIENIEQWMPPKQGTQRVTWLSTVYVAWNNTDTAKLRETWTNKIVELTSKYNEKRKALAPPDQAGKEEKEDEGDEPVIDPPADTQPSVEAYSQPPQKEAEVPTVSPEILQQALDAVERAGVTVEDGEDVEMFDADADQREHTARADKGKGREILAAPISDPDISGLHIHGPGLPASASDGDEAPQLPIGAPPPPDHFQRIAAKALAEPLPKPPPRTITNTSQYFRPRSTASPAPSSVSQARDLTSIDPALRPPSNLSPHRNIRPLSPDQTPEIQPDDTSAFAGRDHLSYPHPQPSPRIHAQRPERARMAPNAPDEPSLMEKRLQHGPDLAVDWAFEMENPGTSVSIPTAQLLLQAAGHRIQDAALAGRTEQRRPDARGFGLGPSLIAGQSSSTVEEKGDQSESEEEENVEEEENGEEEDQGQENIPIRMTYQPRPTTTLPSASPLNNVRTFSSSPLAPPKSSPRTPHDTHGGPSTLSSQSAGLSKTGNKSKPKRREASPEVVISSGPPSVGNPSAPHTSDTWDLLATQAGSSSRQSKRAAPVVEEDQLEYSDEDRPELVQGPQRSRGIERDAERRQQSKRTKLADLDQSPGPDFPLGGLKTPSNPRPLSITPNSSPSRDLRGVSPAAGSSRGQEASNTSPLSSAPPASTARSVEMSRDGSNGSAGTSSSGSAPVEVRRGLLGGKYDSEEPDPPLPSKRNHGPPKQYSGQRNKAAADKRKADRILSSNSEADSDTVESDAEPSHTRKPSSTANKKARTSTTTSSRAAQPIRRQSEQTRVSTSAPGRAPRASSSAERGKAAPAFALWVPGHEVGSAPPSLAARVQVSTGSAEPPADPSNARKRPAAKDGKDRGEAGSGDGGLEKQGPAKKAKQKKNDVGGGGGRREPEDADYKGPRTPASQVKPKTRPKSQKASSEQSTSRQQAPEIIVGIGPWNTKEGAIEIESDDEQEGEVEN